MGGILVVCGECYNVGLIDRSVSLYFVFENSKNTRNELARPVMGTIFLVLFCLPPHNTNALQSLDVAVFKSLKNNFSKAVRALSFSKKNSAIMKSRSLFPTSSPVLQNVESVLLTLMPFRNKK